MPPDEIKGEARGEFFSTMVRIELSSMKAQIAHVISGRVEQELNPLLEHALGQALDERNWKHELERLAREAINEKINTAVKDLILYNYQIDLYIKKAVGKAIAEAVEAKLAEKPL